jgi:hypothetical protein
MTGRERVLSLVDGVAPDRTPVLCWPQGHELGDIAVSIPGAPLANDGRLNLVEVWNPFGRALRRGENPNEVLSDDPDRGSRFLESLVAETRQEIESALAAGADGVLYALFGAGPGWSTPMQYGGFHLERDRELLEQASNALFNMLLVVGSPEAYLDFVSDLPAQAFAWDRRRSGFDAVAVRALRPGLLCAEDPAADIQLRPGSDRQFAESMLAKEAVARA